MTDPREARVDLALVCYAGEGPVGLADEGRLPISVSPHGIPRP
jgi:hypothetical protein